LCVGCVTAPAPQEQGYSAAYVGDRTSIEFDETVVTVWKGGAGSAPLNLHIALGALVNPKKSTLSSPQEVVGIIRRLEPRINSRLVGRFTGTTGLAPEQLRVMRAEVEQIGQAALNDAFARWSKAADYEVDGVVT